MNRHNLSNNDDFILKNKDKYISFIQKYKNTTNCEKKRILNYLKLKNKFNILGKTNLNFHTIYKYGIQHDINQLLRFQSLLLHFMNYNKAQNILDTLSTNNINNSTEGNHSNALIHDIEIFNIIFNQNNLNSKKKINEFMVCNKWNYAIELLFLEWMKLKNTKLKISSVKYLDIGCGNAVKTLLFQNLFKLSKNNVFGSDIETWGPYKENKKKYPYNLN